MFKRPLHTIKTKISDLSLVILIVLFALSLGVSIYALRSNNQTMSTLRQAVYVADTNNTGIEQALSNLRQYVYSHMNTNLRAGSNSSQAPIQLVGSFNRAVAAEQARIAALGTANKVYIEAQAACENPKVVLTVRAQCVQDYVAAHGSGVPQLQLPPKDTYSFDFISPIWSPDLAGWSLVATALLGVIIIARLLAGLIIKKTIQ